MKNPLAVIHGKTIKLAKVRRREAVDLLTAISLELIFTDGSCYSFLIEAQPQAHGIFFKSEDDNDSAKEVELAKL